MPSLRWCKQVIDNDDMRAVRSHELDFVRQRSENVGNGPNDFLSHLEISHWMVVLNSQMWESRLGLIPLGKQAIGPYCDWRVLNALATVPVEDRYIVGMRGKWLLKELLASQGPRLPHQPAQEGDGTAVAAVLHRWAPRRGVGRVRRAGRLHAVNTAGK